MYGCFDPYIIYGFKELDTDTEISREYFEKKFEDSIACFRIWASELIRLHACTAVYGVVAKLSSDGVCTVTDEEKQLVQKIYDEVSKKKQYGEIGFYLAISGDYESQHTRYNPDKLKVVVEEAKRAKRVRVETEEELEVVIEETKRAKTKDE